MSDPLQNPTLTLPEALARAKAHWQAGQAPQAEGLCRRILAQIPGQPDALHLLGLMAHAYGRLDEAADFLQQACAAPAAPALYWSNLAEMRRQQGQLAEGEAAARRAVALDPRLSGAWNNLGILLQEMGRYDESRTCLEKVHQREPDNPQALNNLGNTCLRQGDTVAAEDYWRQALARDPRYPQPYSNLAKLLADRGEWEEAIAAGRRAITLDPHLADAYINLAAAEKGRGRSPAALRWIDALLAFQPKRAGALLTKALLLKDEERLPEALVAAEAAVHQASESADAQYALGHILQELGRIPEALEAFAKAAALPGTRAEDALCHRATLYMEQGEPSMAEQAFAEARSRFPDSASVWYNWADLHHFTLDDPLVPEMEALLERSQNRLPKDRMLLHFALGKAYLDRNQSPKAFAHLHAGNAIRRASFIYDAAQTTEIVDRILATFPAADQKNVPVPETVSTGPRPVFVVGMPRSGTTLTEQVLASHPAILGAGELSWLRRTIEATGSYPEIVATLTPTQKMALGQAYRDRIAALIPDGRTVQAVVDKMPSNCFYAGLIPLLLPEAKIIHCRRDPVDTCLSCYSKNFSGDQRFAYDLRELGQFYRDYVRLMDHWRQVLPPSCFLEIDYEQMVEDLEGTSRRMLNFLELDWDPACLEFHRTERAVRTASVNQVRQPLYQRAVGRWKIHAEALQPLLDVLDLRP
ncbi:MAG: sulfotransferase [Acidithiobacillus sp.]|uniref:tetratricopeptide repeat-containing sulfotransferase family protein n=1 Tax=Acidithiobacillus sp. TaxID=1872118 RepID=UPI003D020BA9